jgi:hypothetical protein
VAQHLEGDCTESANAYELAQIHTYRNQTGEDDEKLHIHNQSNMS